MKLKKIITMGVAAMMTVSAISTSAFAVEESVIPTKASLGLISMDQLPEIGTTVSFIDENGVAQEATVAGYLDIQKMDENSPMPIWHSEVFDDVEIPRDIDGNQGVIVGKWYSASTSDNYGYFTTSDWNAYLHTLNFSLTERYLTNNGYKYNIYYGNIEEEGSYSIGGVRLVSGRSYAYTFSSQQNTNSQATCDLELYSK